LATHADPQFRDAHRAVALAKKAVELKPREGNYWQTLAWAEYRVGDWKAAVAAMEKVKKLGSAGDSTEWFLLAMAHWQLGHKDDARKWYDRAVEWMAKNQPGNGELLRFRAEAEERLGIDKPRD
jgi:Flp pilus assembly protein TadD